MNTSRLANASGKTISADVNTKVFTITWTTGTGNLAAMQEAIDWYNAGNCPIIYYKNPWYVTNWFYMVSIRSDSYSRFLQTSTTDDLASNDFVHIVRTELLVTRSSWTVTCYIDWEQDAQFTDNTSLPSSCWQNWMLSRPNLQDQCFSAWAMWDKYILENIAWSADDITSYYNQTKWTYWL